MLLACSGGADSTALAVALSRLGLHSAVLGHVDHGLRPESAAEARLVEALAARLGLEFALERTSDLSASVRELGLEAAAREARYRALALLARRTECSIVVTAHTRQDQAETLLLRLVRGAGPGALAGVRPSRRLAPGVRLVRPLLSVTRAQTEACCAQVGETPLRDPHNRDPRRGRTRVREALPTLEALLGPGLEAGLARAAALLSEQEEWMAAQVQAARADCQGSMGLDARKLAGLHPFLARRLVVEEARAAGVRPEAQHVSAALRLLSKGQGGVDVPGGRIQVSEGQLTCAATPRAPQASLLSQPPDVTRGNEMGVRPVVQGVSQQIRPVLDWTPGGQTEERR